MIIILDTNIICADWMLRSTKFELVLDYVRKTGSSFVVPLVVLDEAIAGYQRELAKQCADHRRTSRYISLLTNRLMPEAEVNLQQSCQEYRDYLRARLSLADTDIVGYREGYLEEIVRRSVHRIKPCSEKGEELRDALLWLIALDVAEAAADRSVVLISNNKKEFGPDTQRLHEDLAGDLCQRNVQVEYYVDLEDFVRAHASKVGYVTRDWILNSISTNSVGSKLVELLNDSLKSWLNKWLTSRDTLYTGYSSPTGSTMEFESFYVYDMADGMHHLTVTYVGETEVEYETRSTSDMTVSDYHTYPDFRSEYVRHVAAFSGYADAESEVHYRYAYPYIRVRVEAEIRDKDVTNWWIDDYEYA